MLVVHVDADNLTVAERHGTLEQELRDKGVAPRAPHEPVTILLPKREIETWIHFFLDGPPVDEVTSYPKYKGRESETWPAAEELARHVREGSQPALAPPSLLDGLKEASRVL